MIYILAGGGSGGHLFPGLAVAEALTALDNDAEVLFVATDREIDKRILAHSSLRYLRQPVRPIPRKLTQLLPFLRCWHSSVRMCEKLMTSGDVAGVLALGGFASGPAIKAAHRIGIRIALLNPDALPGRANRFGMKRAEKIFVQWQDSVEHFGTAAERCEVIGCPIRRSILNYPPGQGYSELALDDQLRTLVVMGGSLGGHNVNVAALRCLVSQGKEFLRGWQVLHITGDDDCHWVQDEYKRAGLAAKVLGFTDRMDVVLAVADLVVNRAGASTLAELTARGVASVLLPYPYHKDNHQLRNAEVLARAGAARILRDYCDGDRTARGLAAVLGECMGDDDALAAMAHAAKQLGSSDAASRVAQWLSDGGRNTKRRAGHARRFLTSDF